MCELESSRNYPLLPSRRKNCLPQTKSLVSKRLGTACSLYGNYSTVMTQSKGSHVEGTHNGKHCASARLSPQEQVKGQRWPKGLPFLLVHHLSVSKRRRSGWHFLLIHNQLWTLQLKPSKALGAPAATRPWAWVSREDASSPSRHSAGHTSKAGTLPCTFRLVPPSNLLFRVL